MHRHAPTIHELPVSAPGQPVAPRATAAGRLPAAPRREHLVVKKWSTAVAATYGKSAYSPEIFGIIDCLVLRSRGGTRTTKCWNRDRQDRPRCLGSPADRSSSSPGVIWPAAKWSRN